MDTPGHIFRDIELISCKIVGFEYFIVLTGAGISTESVIPNYWSKGKGSGNSDVSYLLIANSWYRIPI